MSLLLLPVEIQLIVLRCLSARDLVRCRQVCKHLTTLIDSEPYFELVTELGAAGYVDNPCFNDSTSNGALTKMDMLKDHIRASSCMHWGSRNMIFAEGKNKNFKAFNNYFFRLAYTNDPDVYHWTPEPHAVEENQTYVLLDMLPSRRTVLGPPAYNKFDFIVDEIAVNVAKNLLVGVKHEHSGPKNGIMCCKLFFKHLSFDHGQSHKDAAKPMVDFRWLSPRQKYIVTVHTMGNVVGVLFTRNSDRIVDGASDVFILYNWTTGILHSQMKSSPCEEYWETFCFISAGAVLIPSTMNGTVNVFVFNDQAMSLTHCVTFLLPDTKHKPGIRRIRLCAHPTPLVETINTHPDDEPPFLTNPEDSVIVFSVDYFYPDASGNYFTGLNLPQVFAVPVRVFHSAIKLIDNMQQNAKTRCDWSCPTGDSKVGHRSCEHKMHYECRRYAFHPLLKRTPHIHSQSWMRNTRWGLETMPEHLDQCVHGSRYLALASHRDIPEEHASAVVIYDFNVGILSRGFELTQSNETPDNLSEKEMEIWENQWGSYFGEEDKRHWPVHEQRLVAAPVTVEIPEVFKAPFVSALPYRVVESEHVFRWDSAILDGERIIGVEFSDENCQSVELLDILIF